MGSLGQERDGVCEIAADGLDHREASEYRERKEQPTLADVTRVTMWAVAMRPVSMPVPVASPVFVIRPVLVAKPMLVGCMLSMVRVLVIAVMLVRVRHGL